MVESTFSYLAEMDEKPVYWISTPPPGTPWRNTRGDFRQLPVEDARTLVPPPTLDDAGFTLVRHRTAVGDLYDVGEIRTRYYSEIERLVAGVTGASRVLAFDYNVRNQPRAERREQGAQGPVRFVHNDYTERSGPQRVRDLLGDEADALLRHRVAVVNVWKPIRGPVQTTPLAVCDARSIAPSDFVLTDLRYSDRTGEIQSLRFNPAHRWFYYPEMQADEVLLLKCYDSDRTVARFTAHSAFDDPTSPADAPARESIEVRTLAFFAPAS